MNSSREGRDFAQSREILSRQPAYQEYDDDTRCRSPRGGVLLMTGAADRGSSASKLIGFGVWLCLGLLHSEIAFGQNPSVPPGIAITNLAASSASLSLVGASNHVIVIQSSS